MSHRPPATTLEEARRNGTLGSLDLERLQDFWRETSDARAENRDFRQDLRELLQQPDAQPILVRGYPGCGKRTEINKVLSELGPLWLVVKLDAHGVLPVSGNEAADVLLAVCTRMVEVAKDHGLALNEDALSCARSSVRAWLPRSCQTTRWTTSSRTPAACCATSSASSSARCP